MRAAKKIQRHATRKIREITNEKSETVGAEFVSFNAPEYQNRPAQASNNSSRITNNRRAQLNVLCQTASYRTFSTQSLRPALASNAGCSRGRTLVSPRRPRHSRRTGNSLAPTP